MSNAWKIAKEGQKAFSRWTKGYDLQKRFKKLPFFRHFGRMRVATEV